MVSAKIYNILLLVKYNFLKLMEFYLILTKVRAALIGFLLPATALIEADTIRPAMLSYRL
jgi:hypothetical protein